METLRTNADLDKTNLQISRICDAEHLENNHFACGQFTNNVRIA